MANPVNYVDLFDRLYPVQHLSGLTDDGQIAVDELNRRYATIRANHASLSAAVKELYRVHPDETFRDLLRPAWEIAYAESFELSPGEIALHRFRAGFDPAGLELDLHEQSTVVHLNYLGGAELVDASREVLVFCGGRLLGPSCYRIHVSQGGVSVYIWEAVVRHYGGRINVVVLRKFNRQGVTSFGPHVARGAVGPGAEDGAEFIVPDIAALGHVYDPRHIKPLVRVSGDSHFRPPPDGSWHSRASGNRLLFVFDGRFGAEPPTFAAVDTTVYWGYEFEGIVRDADALWRVPLLNEDGLPAPVWRIEDLDVWLDGRKLLPNVHYWISWGNPSNPSQPPALVFADVPLGPRHLKVIKNAPHDPLSEISFEQDRLGDANGIVRFPLAGRAIRLARDMGIVFAGGYLEQAGTDIDVVCDNLALHFKALTDRTQFNYRARFVFSSELAAQVADISGRRTQLEELGQLLAPASYARVDGGGNPAPVPIPLTSDTLNLLEGITRRGEAGTPDPSEGLYLEIDLVERYRIASARSVVPLLERPETRPVTLTPAYYLPVTAGSTIEEAVFDFRVEPVPFFAPWVLPDGTLDVDCREVGVPVPPTDGRSGSLPPAVEPYVRFSGGELELKSRPSAPPGSVAEAVFAAFPWEFARSINYSLDFRE